MTKYELRALFDYDGDSGSLVWRSSAERGKAWNTRYAGAKAGTRKHRKGWDFIQVTICGRTHLAHRLVWIYHHGDAPDVLDHINRDPTDNRIENLRPASRSENRINSTKARSNTGFRGVYVDGTKFRAVIMKYGKNVCLGVFDDISQAISARRTGEEKMFGAFSQDQNCA